MTPPEHVARHSSHVSWWTHPPCLSALSSHVFVYSAGAGPQHFLGLLKSSLQDDISKPKKCWGANIGHEKKQDDWTGKKWPWSPSRQAARLFSQPPLKRTGDRYRLGRSTSARLACSPRWCFRGRRVLRRHRTGAPFSLPARFADALGGACRRCRASDELRDVVPAASGSICGASHDRKCR